MKNQDVLRDAKINTVKTSVLGRRYDLSLAFVTPSQMRKAMRYKKSKARKTSNVLAFPLSKHSGEILICRSAMKPFTEEYLFIHGLLHLKGLRHGATMEYKEQALLKRFGYAKTSNRNRPGHTPHKGSNRRATK